MDGIKRHNTADGYKRQNAGVKLFIIAANHCTIAQQCYRLLDMTTHKWMPGWVALGVLNKHQDGWYTCKQLPISVLMWHEVQQLLAVRYHNHTFLDIQQ